MDPIESGGPPVPPTDAAEVDRSAPNYGPTGVEPGTRAGPARESSRDLTPLLERGQGTTNGLYNRAKSVQMILLAGPGLMLSIFAVGFDLSFLTTNYSRRIASSLDQLHNAVWIALVGAIAETCFQPLHARLSRILGTRQAIFLAAAVTASGLFLCSLSNNIWFLAFSRFITGSGTSGVQLLVVIFLAELLSLEDLALWRSAVIMTETCAHVLGAPVGSALTEQVGWQLTFGLESLTMLIATCMLFITLRMPMRAHSTAPSIRSLDIPGTCFLLLADAVPLIAMNLQSHQTTWNPSVDFAWVALTIALLNALYIVETRVGSQPIIPLRLFANPAVAAVIACGATFDFAYNQAIFSLALYIETRTFETDSLFSDWALSFVFLGRPIGSACAGVVVKYMRRYRTLVLWTVMVNAVIYACITVRVIHIEEPACAPVLVAIGFILGVLENALVLALLSATDQEDQASSYALYNLAIGLAGDIGIGVSSALTQTVVRSRLGTELGTSPETDKIIRKALQSLDFVRELPLKTRTTVLEAMSAAIETTFGLTAIVILLGFIAALHIRELKTSRNFSPAVSPG